MTVLSSDHTSLTLLSGVDAGSHSYVVPREAEVFLFSCTSEPQLTETAFSTGISVSLHILLIMKVIKHKHIRRLSKLNVIKAAQRTFAHTSM